MRQGASTRQARQRIVPRIERWPRERVARVKEGGRTENHDGGLHFCGLRCRAAAAGVVDKREAQQQRTATARPRRACPEPEARGFLYGPPQSINAVDSTLRPVRPTWQGVGQEVRGRKHRRTGEWRGEWWSRERGTMSLTTAAGQIK